MRSALFAVLVLLAIFLMQQGAPWLALAIIAVAAVSYISSSASGHDSAKPFFYNSADLGVPTEPEEQMFKVKHMEDWGGYEDDFCYHDQIGDSIGQGMGKGFGLLR